MKSESKDFTGEILEDWIEEQMNEGPEEIRQETKKRDADLKPLINVPVPNIQAAISAKELSSEQKLRQLLECFRQLIVTARNQIAVLKEDNSKLKIQLESDGVVGCPCCQTTFKSKANRYLPNYVKAIPSTCTLELKFRTKEELFTYLDASRLDTDENGVPVHTRAPKPVPQGLADAGSQLTNLLLEKEKSKLVLPRMPDPPTQKEVATRMLRRSPRKLNQNIGGRQMEKEEPEKCHSQERRGSDSRRIETTRRKSPASTSTPSTKRKWQRESERTRVEGETLKRRCTNEREHVSLKSRAPQERKTYRDSGKREEDRRRSSNRGHGHSDERRNAYRREYFSRGRDEDTRRDDERHHRQLREENPRRSSREKSDCSLAGPRLNERSQSFRIQPGLPSQTPSSCNKENRRFAEDHSDGELLDDDEDIEEVDNISNNGEHALNEDKKDAEEGMSFGEIVYDDNDVFGENYVSDSP